MIILNISTFSSLTCKWKKLQLFSVVPGNLPWLFLWLFSEWNFHSGKRSKTLIFLWDKYIVPLYKREKTGKKVFTRRNRFMVLIKKKYGLPGIVVLSPLLLSIPVGAFLTTKYYGTRIDRIIWLLAGQIGWSFVYTCFQEFFY